ncbi:MAG: hypothetical protein MI892_10575 [Desulfobacterales bacterium]|nr:hypothetical protein [Desulfobacterales bacterium]
MTRFIFFFLLAATPLFWAEYASGAQTWKRINTRYLMIQYQSRGDLERFDRGIEPVKHVAGFLGFKSSEGPKTNSLSEKLDLLVKKVQLILDMQKPIMVNLRIYPGPKELKIAYFKLYKKQNQPRAWYLYETNTIYMNAQDVSSGMLAHEIAHAVIDHYLEARPPRATAEILARYVDAHLNDEAKVY